MDKKDTGINFSNVIAYYLLFSAAALVGAAAYYTDNFNCVSNASSNTKEVTCHKNVDEKPKIEKLEP